VVSDSTVDTTKQETFRKTDSTLTSEEEQKKLTEEQQKPDLRGTKLDLRPVLELPVKGLKVISLEQFLHLGIIHPKSTLTTNLKFIALQEGLATLEQISLYDALSDRMFEVKEMRQLYVQDIPKIKNVTLDYVMEGSLL